MAFRRWPTCTRCWRRSSTRIANVRVRDDLRALLDLAQDAPDELTALQRMAAFIARALRHDGDVLWRRCIRRSIDRRIDRIRRPRPDVVLVR
jgi:hypothetical protein